MKKLEFLATTASALAVLLLATPVRAQKAAENMAENRQAFRASVMAIHAQIDSTLGALDKLVQSKDPASRTKALKAYSKEVDAMSKQIDKTRSYAQSMKEKGQAFFKQWEKSTKKVSNETLKASADARRTALQGQYEKIQTGIAEAKEVSGRFWQNLQDLQKYFAADLSDQAVAGSADLVAKTKEDGKTIQGYVQKVTQAVDEVGKAGAEAPVAAEAPAK